MKKKSPCESCRLMPDPKQCKRKNCTQWSSWWLQRWEKINGFYEKYKEGTKENGEDQSNA